MPVAIVIAIVAFLASLLGPLCGIGGGVIIKPVVDALGVLSVAQVSFLSSVSVLVMSLSTLMQYRMNGTEIGGGKSTVALALGSAVGGVIGKALFNMGSKGFGDANAVGAVQAAVLIGLSLLVLIYTLNRSRVKPLALTSALGSGLVGAIAGACWGFLGIGGGPFNLAILTFVLGMDTKTAARASLLVIAFSQTASLAYSLATASVAMSAPEHLIAICLAALAGSYVGKGLAARVQGSTIDRIYLFALVLIMAISGFNVYRFTML